MRKIEVKKNMRREKRRNVRNKQQLYFLLKCNIDTKTTEKKITKTKQILIFRICMCVYVLYIKIKETETKKFQRVTYHQHQAAFVQ